MFRLNDIKISKNFKLCEFESPDTKEVKLDPELLERLQAVRDLTNSMLYILSGYRTFQRNSAVGGATGSFHLNGYAADIRSFGAPLEDLYHACVFCGFRGVIVYEDEMYIHVDTRPKPYFNAPLNWILEAKNRNKFKK